MIDRTGMIRREETGRAESGGYVDAEQEFPAVIVGTGEVFTSGGGSGATAVCYAWKELIPTRNGTYEVKVGGREGNAERHPAFEMSGREDIPVTAVVWLRKWASNPVYGMEYVFACGCEASGSGESQSSADVIVEVCGIYDDIPLGDTFPDGATTGQTLIYGPDGPGWFSFGGGLEFADDLAQIADQGVTAEKLADGAALRNGDTLRLTKYT